MYSVQRNAHLDAGALALEILNHLNDLDNCEPVDPKRKRAAIRRERLERLVNSIRDELELRQILDKHGKHLNPSRVWRCDYCGRLFYRHHLKHYYCSRRCWLHRYRASLSYTVRHRKHVRDFRLRWFKKPQGGDEE